MGAGLNIFGTFIFLKIHLILTILCHHNVEPNQYVKKFVYIMDGTNNINFSDYSQNLNLRRNKAVFKETRAVLNRH